MTEQPVNTFDVTWTPQGFQVEPGNPDSAVYPEPDLPGQVIIPAVAPDPVVPVPQKQWYCVVSDEGLGQIYGPYLTEAAAQSLIDEGTPGTVQPMVLA